MLNDDFSDRILQWFATHGRHNLAWQQLGKEVPDPYPVWISEIMLQQTQVATVIGYFDRFMGNFPTLDALANASLDKVLDNWAGLGYYARARNLHKTAQDLQKIIEQTNAYPQTLDEWQALSGIGKSTAGAIMAMGMGKFGVICDGNVKRVLTRHFGIADDITKPATDKALWSLAERLTPQDDSGRYAQAMMDMGATLCTKNRPACERCPVVSTCVAHKNGTPTAYPVKAKKSPKPTHQSFVLQLIDDDKALWVKRGDDGIWANLWCLPLFSTTRDDTFVDAQLGELLSDALTNAPESLTPIHQIRHTLTHFHWQLSLIAIPLDKKMTNKINVLLDACQADFVWLSADKMPSAVPSAMKKLMTKS